MHTTRFGDIEVRDADVITLPRGLIGFPELQRYVLFDHAPGSPLRWMQSLDDGSVAFLTVSPTLLNPDYVAEVTDAEVADIGLDTASATLGNTGVAVILTVGMAPTANFKAPIVFNLDTRQGKQVILHDATYTTRHKCAALDRIVNRMREGA